MKVTKFPEPSHPIDLQRLKLSVLFIKFVHNYCFVFNPQTHWIDPTQPHSKISRENGVMIVKAMNHERQEILDEFN
jgi:hypothetical protein